MAGQNQVGVAPMSHLVSVDGFLVALRVLGILEVDDVKSANAKGLLNLTCDSH